MSEAASIPRIALVGNPNCGKTALFNLLTGSRQKVANYAGVTVERKEGRLHAPSGRHYAVLDLPGAYSLNAASLDEAVTRVGIAATSDAAVLGQRIADRQAQSQHAVVRDRALLARARALRVRPRTGAHGHALAAVGRLVDVETHRADVAVVDAGDGRALDGARLTGLLRVWMDR